MIFSPVLDGSEITKPAEDMWVSPKSVYSSIDKIRQVDYSCFIEKFYFMIKRTRQVCRFLYKRSSSRHNSYACYRKPGIMWQENVGADRESPARMLFR